MGAWGFQPWESDQGADWFSELMGGGAMVGQVHETLSMDVEEDFLAIWAASYVVECFALPHIWPVDDCETVLASTERVLTLALEDASEVRDSDTLRELVNQRLTVIRGRRRP